MPGILSSTGLFFKAQDKHGITALLAAVWEGHTDCVKLLLNSGADRTGKAPDGTSYTESTEKSEIRALLAS